jgi:hypothetical protein
MYCHVPSPAVCQNGYWNFGGSVVNGSACETGAPAVLELLGFLHCQLHAYHKNASNFVVVVMLLIWRLCSHFFCFVVLTPSATSSATV